MAADRDPDDTVQRAFLEAERQRLEAVRRAANTHPEPRRVQPDDNVPNDRPSRADPRRQGNMNDIELAFLLEEIRTLRRQQKQSMDRIAQLEAENRELAHRQPVAGSAPADTVSLQEERDQAIRVAQQFKQRELPQLLFQISSLHQEMTQKDIQIAQLSAELDEARSHVGAPNLAHESADQNGEVLERLAHAESALADQTRHLEETQHQLAEWVASRQAYQERIGELEQRLCQAETDLSQARQDEDQLLAELRERTLQIEERDQMIRSLTQQVGELERTLKQQSSAPSSDIAALCELTTRERDEARTELTQMQELLAQALQELESLSQRHAATESQRDGAIKELEQAKVALEEARGRQTAEADVASRLDSVQYEWDQARFEIERLNQERDYLRGEAVEHQAEVDRRGEEIVRLQIAERQQREELEHVRGELFQRMELDGGELATLRASHQKLHEERDHFASRLAEQQFEIDRRGEELNALRRSELELRNELERLREEAVAARNGREEAAQRIGQLADDIAILRSSHEPLRQERDHLAARLSEQQAEIDRRVEELSRWHDAERQLREELERLRGDLEAANKAKVDWAERSEYELAELNALRSSHQQLQHERDEVERRLAEQQAEIDRRGEDLQRLSAESDRKIAAMSSEIGMLRDERDRLLNRERETEEALKAHQELHKQIQELYAPTQERDTLRKYEQLLEEKTRKIHELYTQIQAMSVPEDRPPEDAALTRMLFEAHDQLQKAGKTHAEIEERDRQLRESQAQWRLELEENESRLRRWHEELQQREQQLQSRESQLRQQRTDIEQLRQRQQEELVGDRNRLTHEREMLRQQAFDLRLREAETKALNEVAEREAARLRAELTQEQLKFARLRETLRQLQESLLPRKDS